MVQRLWAIRQRVWRWSKSHPVRPVAILLLLMGLASRASALFSDLSAELIGIAITVLVIDELNEYRAEQREKRALILQMGSPDNAFAVEAVRVLREHGRLTDGSLRGVNLARANLRRANLGGANLQEATLARVSLQESVLRRANLQGAVLARANLQGATLTRANLQRVNLRDANLRGAILFGADLAGANLDGATANSRTQWPEGFQVPDTIEMAEE